MASILYKHQKQIELELSKHKHYAIFAEQGTGKTLPILNHLLWLLKTGDIGEALIVAPKSALGAWKRDFGFFNEEDQNILKKCLVLVNYDKFSRSKSTWDKYIHYWDAIVLDESHYIASRTSKRTMRFIGDRNHGNKSANHGLNRMSEYRYILTGTPITNGRLEQYFPQMEFLEPGIFGTYRDFSDRYLIQQQLRGTYCKFVVGYRHKEELLKIVSEHSYRITKKDCEDIVLEDKMPDRLIYCDMLEPTIYNDALKNFISSASLKSDDDIVISNPLARFTKLRSICSGFIVDEYGDLHSLRTSKTKELNNLLDTFDEDEKIVIFAEYKVSIQKIKELLDSRNESYVVLDGEQKDKEIWKIFQNDKSIKYIVCQYRTASAGIDLFSSNEMIFYEPHLSTTIIEQSRDRIHRNGQTKPCNYYWLITKNSIEEDIYKRLASKQDFNNQCMLAIARYKKGAENEIN